MEDSAIRCRRPDTRVCIGLDVSDGSAALCHRYPEMAGATEDCAAAVAELGGGSGRLAVAGVAGLRHLLVHDAIQFLLRVKVIVAMEDDADLVP